MTVLRRKSEKLKPGDLCYKVIRQINPDDQPDTWAIVSRAVKAASDKQITFDGPGYKFETSRERFSPSDLGRIFYRTPVEAVEAFVQARRSDITSAERKIVDANAAIEWAEARWPRVS